MLHYNPRHVSSNTLLILRRSDCIVTASGIVTLCKRLYSAQSDLLRMSIVLLETYRGLECNMLLQKKGIVH
jgi:hypothetical protein